MVARCCAGACWDAGPGCGRGERGLHVCDGGLAPSVGRWWRMVCRGSGQGIGLAVRVITQGRAGRSAVRAYRAGNVCVPSVLVRARAYGLRVGFCGSVRRVSRGQGWCGRPVRVVWREQRCVGLRGRHAGGWFGGRYRH